ncbi:MAG: MOSC domain-containing protein [Verrucomicrobia bacterium]|nr:MOSC domain-containing protein [Verrucomicrobiota bacterium]
MIWRTYLGERPDIPRAASTMTNNISVKRIVIYPVKGCGGIDLKTANVEARGIAMDRRWMIVDNEGRFVSQRQLPGMAVIKPSIRDDTLQLTYLDDSISLPLKVHDQDKWSAVTVWRDSVQALRVVEAGSLDQQMAERKFKPGLHA